jgi:type II secretory pathway predicted ATPase ExeA
MYLSHFHLQEKPFKISTDPKFLWLGEKHKETLETLRYGILYDDGYVVVTGNVGTGKTTLASALANDLSDKVIVRKIPYPNVDILDFLKLVSTAYGIIDNFQSEGSFLAHFEVFLHSSFSTGKKVVLIIDEAQNLSHGHLEELLHLSNIEENGIRLLNIVFVGQNEFNDILLEDSNKALRQRVVINCNLAPLTQDETRQYILHRLKVARCEREIFTSEAIQDIFLFSQGIPRLINIVCDLALLITYFQSGEIVQPETVKQCIERLRLPNEKTEFAWTGTDRSSGIEGKVGHEIGEKKRDEVRGEIVRENRRKSARVRIAFTAAFGLLVVFFGLILILYRHGQIQRNSTYGESKKQVSQESSRTQTATGALKDQGLPAVAPLATKEPPLSQGVGRKKSALEDRRGRVGESPAFTTERSVRESSSEDTEEVEPSKVIDWLLEKRSDKK